MSRTGARLDDQTAGGGGGRLRHVELPEFLRPRPPVSSEEAEEGDSSFEAGSLPPEARRGLELEEGTLATPSKVEAVFGVPAEADFGDPELTSRRGLGEFGFADPSAASSADASFVTASSDVSGSGSGEGRAPPPPYPGLGRLCASNLGRAGSRAPVVYLSPNPKSTEPTLLKADYV